MKKKKKIKAANGTEPVVGNRHLVVLSLFLGRFGCLSFAQQIVNLSNLFGGFLSGMA
jgi:hypothetical protein